MSRRVALLSVGFVLVLALSPTRPSAAGDRPGPSVVAPAGTTGVRLGGASSDAGPAPGEPPAPVAPSPEAARGAGGTGCNDAWRHAGGTPGRDGRSDELGPATAELLWSGGRPSIIAWQPVVDGERVFMVRQTAFGSVPDGSPVVAMDLASGAELWAVHIPYESGDWTTWIAAADRGKVYASRAGNGSSVSAPLYALSQVDGAVAWGSADEVDAGGYDGVVLAPDGDLLVGNFTRLLRIRAADGTTAWGADRVCSVSSSCGAATFGDAVYVADAAPGGHVLVRFDLATGARQYESPVMTGFTLQNTPFVGADGTVYLVRTQNNVATDYLYAFEDTGTGFVERWHVAAAWTTFSESALGPDGAVYAFASGYELVRLDPATGVPTATAGLLPDCASPRMATDGDGRLYLGNGGFAAGRLRVFDAALQPLWDVAVPNLNIGAPAIGRRGTLVVCGIGTDVRAYRAPDALPACALFADGFETGDTSRWSGATP